MEVARIVIGIKANILSAAVAPPLQGLAAERICSG